MHSRDAHMRARTLPIYMVCVSKVTGLFACTCVGLLAWSTVLLSKQAQGAQACLVFASCTVAPASVFLMPAFARSLFMFGPDAMSPTDNFTHTYTYTHAHTLSHLQASLRDWDSGAHYAVKQDKQAAQRFRAREYEQRISREQ
eukprot:353983-Pelagomonas_calceolata.AAC.1